MNKKVCWIVSLAVLFIPSSQAVITCEGKTRNGDMVTLMGPHAVEKDGTADVKVKVIHAGKTLQGTVKLQERNLRQSGDHRVVDRHLEGDIEGDQKHHLKIEQTSGGRAFGGKTHTGSVIIVDTKGHEIVNDPHLSLLCQRSKG